MRDADLYSQSYMLHMLFLHLANGPAVIITILSGEEELLPHCLPAEVVCVFSSWKVWELQVWCLCKDGLMACGFNVTSCGLIPARASVH